MEHIFAFYVQDTLSIGKVTIQNKDLFHRLKHVLRLPQQARCELFNKQMQAEACIVEFVKKDTVVFDIYACKPVNKQSSSVTFLLPLLKKEALMQAVYSLTELGVLCIQLCITQKSRQALHGSEFDKLQKVSIAAAEQAKTYALPDILLPIQLQECTSDSSVVSLWFDEQGESLQHCLPHMTHQKPLALFVGPEGGVTHDERMYLQKCGMISCRLTTTILRSVQAIGLGAGVVQSLRSI